MVCQPILLLWIQNSFGLIIFLNKQYPNLIYYSLCEFNPNILKSYFHFNGIQLFSEKTIRSLKWPNYCVLENRRKRKMVGWKTYKLTLMIMIWERSISQYKSALKSLVYLLFITKKKYYISKQRIRNEKSLFFSSFLVV